VRELSKGGAQRVAVAQAFLGDPDLLVLDESWTGLDAPARAELEGCVTERVNAGGTAVFVDHDPHRLAGSAPAVRHLAGGRLSVPAAGAGRRMLVEAEGPPGTDPPVLPGRPGWERLPDGAVRLRVPAAASDAVLAALLADPDARWHVRRVEPEP
jgi:energy-coupling factor transporter ATP-binding protein EcfA2